jgi:hypothetical protein
VKSLIIALTIGLALPVLAADKTCQLELNQEYENPSERNPDLSMTDSFANLAARLGEVVDLQAIKERRAAMNPKNIQARDTFSYGKGANVLQPGDLRRAFHPKAHGCVTAELRVDYDLSQVEGIGNDIGIFNKTADGKLPTYKDLVVRLSNARGQVQDDKADDLRGLAIKIKGVDGARVSTRAHDENDTQDLLFTNAPVHFAKDAPEMVRFAEFMQNPIGKLVKGLFWPASWAKTFEGMGNALKASKDTKENRTGSVLTARYYSRVPFLVGKKAAKFSVTPSPCDWWTSEKGLEPYTYRGDPGTTSQPKWAQTEDKLAFNYLREEMISRLDPTNGADTCFDVNVQFQVDACKQPIEAADVEWKREEAPVIRVGQLRVPKQVFAGVDKPSKSDQMCEEISYNPWHALAAHKPLGNMNRAREHVYYELQKSRTRR